ncbi:MAG: ATP-binding protein [Acidobacteriota bacterium]
MTDASGLHHMVWEVVANSLDQFLAGRCSRVDVTLLADGAISVDDDGPGIRLDEVDGVSFAEHALTTHHNTPTLDGHAPHVHVGHVGLGLFPICALSSRLALDVFRDGAHFQQHFAAGRATTPLQDRGPTDRTGTRITLHPDPEIFTSTWFDPGLIANRLREISFLLPGLTATVQDQRKHTFHSPDGLTAWVEARTRLDRDFVASRPFAVHGAWEDILVEAAASWGHPFDSSIESFANVERTTEGGTHVRGLLFGLVAGLRTAAPQLCEGRTRSDLERLISRGLVAIVCVRLNDPTYGGPTRDKLVTEGVRDVVQRAVTERFSEYLLKEPELVRRFGQVRIL